MKFNLAFRGYLEGQVVFEDRVSVDSEDRTGGLAELARSHAALIETIEAIGPSMLEIEFLDEPDQSKRFFRIGSDRSMMREPLDVDLERPHDALAKWKGR